MARERARQEISTEGRAGEGENVAMAPPLPPRGRALLPSHPSIRQAERMHIVSGGDENGGWRERLRVHQQHEGQSEDGGTDVLESFTARRAERGRERTVQEASAALPSGARSQSGFSDSLDQDAWKSTSGSRYNI